MTHHAKLDPLGLGYTLAALSALCMIVLSILGYFGYYLDGVAAMEQWHLFYELTITGVILGVLEAIVSGFIIGFLFGRGYNFFVK